MASRYKNQVNIFIPTAAHTLPAPSYSTLYMAMSVAAGRRRTPGARGDDPAGNGLVAGTTANHKVSAWLVLEGVFHTSGQLLTIDSQEEQITLPALLHC
jgi:hypothetical protein